VAPLLLLVLLLTTAVAACDDGQTIRVENKTDQTIVVYEDGVPTELISAGASRDFETLQFRGSLTYEIRFLCDGEVCDQTVLAERTITWEQLQQTEGITITVP